MTKTTRTTQTATNKELSSCVCVCVCVPPLPPYPAHTVGLNSRIASRTPTSPLTPVPASVLASNCTTYPWEELPLTKCPRLAEITETTEMTTTTDESSPYKRTLPDHRLQEENLEIAKIYRSNINNYILYSRNIF